METPRRCFVELNTEGTEGTEVTEGFAGHHSSQNNWILLCAPTQQIFKIDGCGLIARSQPSSAPSVFKALVCRGLKQKLTRTVRGSGNPFRRRFVMGILVR